MGFKGLVQLEAHAFYILFISVLIVLWWVAIWGIVDHTVSELEQKYGISAQQQYFGILAAIVVLIGLHPQFLERI